MSPSSNCTARGCLVRRCSVSPWCGAACVAIPIPVQELREEPLRQVQLVQQIRKARGAAQRAAVPGEEVKFRTSQLALDIAPPTRLPYRRLGRGGSYCRSRARHVRAMVADDAFLADRALAFRLPPC